MTTRIYHYTSLESLAYILSSGRIRFTRLDQFDDVLEAQQIGQFDFGKMLFASSWIASATEDYPQWSMYGDAMRGVRISFPGAPFDWHGFVPPPGMHALDTFVPMPISEAISDTFMVNPFLSKNDFCRAVTYVDDVAATWKARTWTDGNNLVSDDPRTLACFKDRRWEFQNEYRFVLHIHGIDPRATSATGPIGPSFTHFDLPVSQMAFQALEVTMGPLRSGADRLIAESLLEKYAPKATLSESSLLGAIRPRSK